MEQVLLEKLTVFQLVKNYPHFIEHKGSLQLFFLIKPTDTLISQIYFCQETLHVSGSSSARHQEFSTVHSALVYVMQV